ncbi:hypothetical protein AVEN_16058-1 [Araneus ventricosus]|uniref:Uncharacterized protein n=1 Tax=Araneus ventricosus TaxID=182803 RepID=A0A4Y2KB13_ARAVE|nr:hypothetical protein AVEN_16058-1 [Araneus ventricosus]
MVECLLDLDSEHGILRIRNQDLTIKPHQPRELFSRKKAQKKAEWLVPPSHHWYKGRKPGLSLSLPCDRQSSTCLSRLASAHMNCLTYSEGNKIYPLCPKCHQHQASPKHILDCLRLDWEEIYSSPLLVIDFIKVNGFLDLV